jgi:hypothetical protein
MELTLFEEVGDALRGLVPRDLGDVHQQVRRYGIKVWFGQDSSQPAKPAREHYEAQVIGAEEVAGARVLALEVGFHSEHPDAAANERVMARLAGSERRWRKTLGEEAELGPFLGRQDRWRRLSETWPDPDLGDTELALELAARLTDYVVALEPLLRSS